MKLLITTVLSLLILTGCSALAPLVTSAVTGSVAKKEPLVGIDTEIVAGDKTQGVDSGTDTKLDDVSLSGNAQVHTNTTGKAINATGTDHLVLNEGVPFWQVAIFSVAGLLIGVFMPQLVIRRK